MTYYAAASYLDARTKKFLFAGEDREVLIQLARQYLTRKLRAMLPPPSACDDDDLLPSLNAPLKTPNEIEVDDMQALAGETVVTSNQVDRVLKSWEEVPCIAFRKDHSYNLRIYDSFPSLKPIAFNLLAVPATSCSSERIFSLMGRIEETSHHRLGEASLHHLAFLRANKMLMEHEVPGAST